MTPIVSPAPRAPKAARAAATFSWATPWVITEPPSQRPFEAIAAVLAPPPSAATSGASDGVTS